VKLTRLYGFGTEPQRLVHPDDFVDPLGGQLPIKATLRNALGRSLRGAEESGNLTRVVLNVDPAPDGERSSLVRDAVRGVAFGSTAVARGAALELARQLSRAMDERSLECLLLVAAYKEQGNDERQVAAWIFPQDEAFRFSPGGNTNSDIELLNDIFSRTSGLRKMALFVGKDIESHFLTGQVLDYQQGRADEVSDFWIERFLDAKLSITPAAGTKVLAEALRNASKASDLTLIERRQVHAAALAMHVMPQGSISLESVANQFLSGKAKKVFLETAENDETRTSNFQLDHAALQQRLKVRNFGLPDDVWVSAPIDQVGDGKLVQLAEPDDGDGAVEHLRIEADVLEDHLASRRRA
jgi:37-kD nucleoid-associated bacterial protein